MSGINLLRVTTTKVRASATDIDGVAEVAATCRTTLATSMAGTISGWQDAGQAGFSSFLDAVRTQADRLRTDLTDIADTLRAAAQAYEDNEAIGTRRLTAPN